MPGICGFVNPSADDRAARASAALSGWESESAFAGESLSHPQRRWGLWREHLGVFNPRTQLDGSKAVNVLFHGEFSGSLPPDVTPAEHLHRGYLEHGVGFVAQLRGAYNAVILDTAVQCVHLLNDKLGSYPLYWHHSDGALYFANSVLRVIHMARIQVSLDETATAQFLKFGFVMGNRTLAKEVSLLGPAHVMSMPFDSMRAKHLTYFESATFFQRTGTVSDVALAQQAFTEAVAASTQPGPALAMSLSGGLDSRAILALSQAPAGHMATYTCGIPGCADEVIGARLANIAGTSHKFLPHRAELLEHALDHLNEMVRLTDGMYLSHGITEIHDLHNLGGEPLGVLLRGHGGELAKTDLAWPFHTDRHIAEAKSLNDVVDYLFERVTFVSDAERLTQVMSSDALSDVVPNAALSFRNILSIEDLEPINACSFLYLYQHHRRFTIASLEMFRSATEIRMPFVDETFLEALFALPPQLRVTTEFHRDLIARTSPELGAVRDANTGTRATAGSLQRYVFDKVNSLLRKVNAPGYRHYHEFDRIFRDVLLDCVESELLAGDAKVKTLISGAGVARAVEQARNGDAQFGYLLQGLLLIELWLRQCELQ